MIEASRLLLAQTPTTISGTPAAVAIRYDVKRRRSGPPKSAKSVRDRQENDASSVPRLRNGMWSAVKSVAGAITAIRVARRSALCPGSAASPNTPLITAEIGAFVMVVAAVRLRCSGSSVSAATRRTAGRGTNACAPDERVGTGLPGVHRTNAWWRRHCRRRCPVQRVERPQHAERLGTGLNAVVGLLRWGRVPFAASRGCCWPGSQSQRRTRRRLVSPIAMLLSLPTQHKLVRGNGQLNLAGQTRPARHRTPPDPMPWEPPPTAPLRTGS